MPAARSPRVSIPIPASIDALAADDRLSRRDRARARLWVGTAVSKAGNHDYAGRVMLEATRRETIA